MGTGKVFKESINIYQDQAKVLFDYYKRAAMQIVREEEESEQRTEDLKIQAETLLKTKKSSQIKFIVWAVLCGICAIFGIVGVTQYEDGFMLVGFGGAIVSLIIFIINISLFVKTKKEIVENASLQDEETEKFANIRRDYKVSKIGVAYVPVATQVPFGQKSFIIDHTSSVDNSNFSLSILHQPEEFSKSIEELENQIDKIPFVEKNENTEEIDSSDYSTSIQNVKLHDYAGQIDRNVRNISYLLNDSENISVGLPVINPQSELSHVLDEFATTDTDDKKVIQVFDTNGFEEKINRFSSLNIMKNQINLEQNEETTEYFKKLMSKLATSIQTVSKMKTSSTSSLLNYTSSIFANVLKASFNQYSPQLEAESIERIRSTTFDYQDEVNSYTPFDLKQSSRVRYDLMSGSWVAEDGSRTAMPFGMNQIDEEIFMPIIKNLMEENRVERLKIYNNIKDQKMSYLNKWHQDVENFYGRNRQEANELIQKMHETFAEFSSAFQTYKSFKDTQDSMKQTQNINSAVVEEKDNLAETIASFEVQAQNCNAQQEEFSAFMERIKDDIDDCAANFGHIEYYEASLRDKESQKMAKSFDEVKNLDARRKSLSSVSTYFASNATVLPEPNMSDDLMNDFTLNLEKNVKESLDYLNSMFDSENQATENATTEKEQTTSNEQEATTETFEQEQYSVQNQDESYVADETAETDGE